jgi:hypothetical protein
MLPVVDSFGSLNSAVYETLSLHPQAFRSQGGQIRPHRHGSFGFWYTIVCCWLRTYFLRKARFQSQSLEDMVLRRCSTKQNSLNASQLVFDPHRKKSHINE